MNRFPQAKFWLESWEGRQHVPWSNRIITKSNQKNNPQLLQLFWIIQLSNSAPLFAGGAHARLTLTANICCITLYILSIEQFCHPKKRHVEPQCTLHSSVLPLLSWEHWALHRERSLLLPSELEGTPAESHNALLCSLTQNSQILTTS